MSKANLDALVPREGFEVCENSIPSSKKAAGLIEDLKISSFFYYKRYKIFFITFIIVSALILGGCSKNDSIKDEALNKIDFFMVITFNQIRIWSYPLKQRDGISLFKICQILCCNLQILSPFHI